MSLIDRIVGSIDFLETREVEARDRFIDPGGNVHEGGINANVDGDHIEPASVRTDEAGIARLTQIVEATEKTVPGDRDIMTHKPRTIDVDPVNGDDSAEWTDNGDFISVTVETHEEGWRRVPFIVQHNTNLFLKGGESFPCLNTPMVWVNQDGGAKFTYRPRPDENRVTIVPDGDQGRQNMQVMTNAAHHSYVERIDWDVQVDTYNTQLTFDNCNFNGTNGNSTSNSTPMGVGGYNSFLNVENSTFGGDAEYAFPLKQGTDIYFANCDGSVNQDLAYALRGGRIHDADNSAITYTNYFGGPHTNMCQYMDDTGTFAVGNGEIRS